MPETEVSKVLRKLIKDFDKFVTDVLRDSKKVRDSLQELQDLKDKGKEGDGDNE